uniref:Uncharacterized protein n=1 Tax=Spironucleus salmonicida TaxID=348837 RepID=V6LQI3_9EUKA|eukprot:EST46508.1 Hypothetical protein SS50377_fx082 [Spironucleus salmonicida]
MIPELAGEIQFQCPLICPQLQLLYKFNEQIQIKYFNNTKQYKYYNNSQQIILLQNQSYQALVRSFIIQKVKNMQLELLNGQLCQNNIQYKNSQDLLEIIKQNIIESVTLDHFYKKLKIAASSNMNKTSVYIYYYLITQQLYKNDFLQNKNSIMQIYFKQSQLSGAFMFLIQLTQQYGNNNDTLQLFKKILENINLKPYNFSIFKTDTISRQKFWQQNNKKLYQICSRVKFMLLLQIFDYELNHSNNSKQQFIMQSLISAVNCYRTVQKYFENLKTEDKRFIIMVKIDIPYFTKLHLVDSSIPDFIIFFFGFEDQFQVMQEIGSPIEYTYNNQQNIAFVTAFESGNHTLPELFTQLSGSFLKCVIQTSSKKPMKQINKLLQVQTDSLKKLPDFLKIRQRIIQQEIILNFPFIFIIQKIYIIKKFLSKQQKSNLTLSNQKIRLNQRDVQLNKTIKNQQNTHMLTPYLLQLQQIYNLIRSKINQSVKIFAINLIRSLSYRNKNLSIMTIKNQYIFRQFQCFRFQQLTNQKQLQFNFLCLA